MRIINAGYEIVTPIDGTSVLKCIEQAGRICYKSEDKTTNDSCRKFVKSLISRGHEAVIEHFSFTVKFICDRGVSHEVVRHRIASFAQESTRYCNYSADKFGKEITVIKPFFWNETSQYYREWQKACLNSEKSYFALLDSGATPQEARSVLPNSLKTEIIVTMNLRQWRHFLTLRTAKESHPQIREIACPLLTELKALIPIVFDGIEY